MLRLTSYTYMKAIIDLYKPLIEEHIDLLTESTVQSNVPWAHTVATAIADTAKRGKTVRGSILLATYALFNTNITDQALHVATVIEYLHTALLIHDDLIDHDELRRGIPSMYKVFEHIGKEKQYQNPEEFGKAMAICVGDIALFGGFSYLSQIKLEHHIKDEITTLLTREFLFVGFGELHDVSLGYSSDIPSVEETLDMYRMKTARYTFSLPMMIGAILAKQSKETIETFEQLGEALGIIFQLTDDLLTLKGSTLEVGKSVGNDIAENKKTYYYVLLMQQASKADKKIISAITGNKKITQSDIETYMTLLSTYKIIETIEETIQTLEHKATESIHTLPLNKEQKNVLMSIPRFLVERTA